MTHIRDFSTDSREGYSIALLSHFIFVIFIIFFVNRLLMLGHDKVLMLIKCLFAFILLIIFTLKLHLALVVTTNSSCGLFMFYFYVFMIYVVLITYRIGSGSQSYVCNLLFFLVYLMFDYLFRLLCI